MKKLYGVVAAALVLSAALPLFAHHSISAEFDPGKEWSVTGTLSRVDWINPHTSTWVDATDPKTGKVISYGCEGSPPATWHRAGLKKDDWEIGQVVTMTCASAKDGTPTWGFIKMLKYKETGRVIIFRVGGE